jgi:hypothetical protein
LKQSIGIIDLTARLSGRPEGEQLLVFGGLEYAYSSKVMGLTKNYPLVMTYRGTVGNGRFDASVISTGRALVASEPEGFWVFGVDAGSLAASASTLPEACAEFHNLFNAILFELAAESATFEDFKAKAEAFFDAANDPNREDWEAALSSLRNGTLENDLGLPRVYLDAIRPGISVSLRTELRPEDFVREAPALVA